MSSFNSDSRVAVCWLFLFAGSLFFGVEGRAFAQETAKVHPSGEITSIEPTALISVRFEIRATDKQIVIPYCWKQEGNEYLLCSKEVYLEVSNGRTWKRATVRRGLAAVLGGLPREELKPAMIAPGDRGYFVFVFSKELLDIQKGEHARVKVSAWTNQESMGDSHPNEVLVSPVFDCP